MLHRLLLSLSLVIGITVLAPAGVYVHVPGVTVRTEPVKTGIVYAYTASWCHVCQSDKPELKALQAQGVHVEYVDCSNGYPGVDSVPIYQVYQDGKLVKVTQSVKELKKILKVLKWIV